MYYTTKGLVLRETQYKENDKLLSVLTEELGLITAKARGVKRKNSPLRAGCGMLTYSTFTLYESKGFYTVNEAEPLELFSALRQDLELLSLGSYFSQVLEHTATEDQAEPEVLSLGLNCLYALDRLKKPQAMVKAVFELRLLCLIGYGPMLEGCGSCGSPEALTFSLTQGTLLCGACRGGVEGERVTLSPGALDALRYICDCDSRRLFSFSLPEKGMKEVGYVTERYLLGQLGQGFSSLDFYKSLFRQGL